MPAVHSVQPPGFVEMRVGAFETFATPAQLSPPTRAPNPPPIGIHRVARLLLPRPAPPPARRLRYIAAQPEVRQRDQRLVAVIPLVADHTSLRSAPAGNTASRAARPR